MSGVVAGCDIDTKQRRFPKSDVLISMFSLMVNTGANLEEVLRTRYPYFDDWAEELELVRAGYERKSAIPTLWISMTCSA